MKNNKKKGFTLVELIIVIVIIGILAVVLIPQITSYIKKAKISKGVQNARNVSTFVMSELILNDKDTYFPNEVVKLCMDNGYNLKSELDDYAYWYDTEQNIIVYKSIDEVCVSADGVSGLPRNRVESISEAYPQLYYVDQQDNAIKKSIDTVNNLVTYGMSVKRPSSISESEWNTYSYKMKVIKTMDSILNERVNAISKMKGISNKASIADYIAQFTPCGAVSTSSTEALAYQGGTVYYSDYGVFNEAMELCVNNTAEVNVERAIVNDGTNSIVTELAYLSIKLHIDYPLLITPEVKTIDDYTVQTITETTFYCSGNTKYNASLLTASSKILGLETISNITYKQITVNPTYSLLEYRFTNGLMINLMQFDVKEVSGGSTLQMVNRTLVTEKFTISGNDVYLPIVKTVDGLSTTYAFYNKPELATSYYNFEGKTVDLGESLAIDSGSIIEDLTVVHILSKYYVPTVAITNDGNEIDFSKFVTINVDGAKVTGNMSVRLTNNISSIRYTAVLVDNELKGYLIDNIGYVINLDLFLDQTVEENGTKTIHGNTQSKVTVKLPEEADDFTNYANCKVKVTYSYEYVEFSQMSLADGSIIYIQTGVRKLGSSTSKVLDYAKGGVSFIDTTVGSQVTLDGDRCNQVKVTNIQIIGQYKGNEIVLFERYYY